MISILSQPLPIGVIGAGLFGRLHAITLAALPEAKLAALVDQDDGRLQSMSTELGGVAAWNNLDEALKQSETRAWVVAASTSSHVPLAKKLLEAGCSVLVEKPLADHLADAQSLADAVKRGPGKLMIGHIGLFNSEFQQLLTEARSRPALRFIDAVKHRPAALRSRFPHETIVDLLMVHDLYVIQALVQSREPVAFHARSNAHATMAELTWENGLVARLAASMLTPPGMPGDGFDRLELFGDGWSARIQPNPRPLELWDDRARWPLELEIGPGARGMLAEELRCFCRVATGQSPPPPGTGYDDAMQIQRWLDQLKSIE